MAVTSKPVGGWTTTPGRIGRFVIVGRQWPLGCAGMIPSSCRASS